MPRLSGPDLAQRIVRRRPAIKVLFATGYAPRRAEREAMYHGRLLSKPVRSADLVMEIEGLLAAR